MSPSDHEISLRFQQGDKNVMTTIYDRYAGPLYGIIFRICQQETIAQDALQDAFVKIWEKRNAYDPEKSKLFTWMYAISRNIAIDQKRKMKAKPTEDIQKASLIVSLNNDLDKKSNSFDLSDNLKNLEQKYQHIINALYFEGYTQQELADDTGIPLGTIKSRLKIGLRELRNVYLKGVLLMIILCAV